MDRFLDIVWCDFTQVGYNGQYAVFHNHHLSILELVDAMLQILRIARKSDFIFRYSNSKYPPPT